MKRIITICAFVLSTIFVFAQDPTIGLRYTSEYVADGYTLFSPEFNNNVFLIDNCGEVVNEWEFSERPSYTCYLLENGNLLRLGRDSLEIRDWDNNLVWTYATKLNGIDQHHDIEPLPNGNILVIGREKLYRSTIDEEGRDPALGSDSLLFDIIIELQPIGTHEASIVWEWRFSDHFVQEFDITKNNYGVVAEHPELMNLNFDNEELHNFSHVNGIDYNEELDQILFTARNLSEFYIIDHSTTMLEASGHTGGNAGKGGDFLYRWGNPQVYNQGLPSDQKIFGPHDPKWVTADCPDYGKISVFNNLGDGTGNFSAIHLIEPSLISGAYQLEDNEFLPVDFFWSWDGDVLGQVMEESKKCGTMQLQNGNMMICENSKGQIAEIRPNGDVAWVYRNPSGTTVHPQGVTTPLVDIIIFRAEKYASDFPGFEGRDLTPISILENENDLSAGCSILLSLEENADLAAIEFINPSNNQQLEFITPVKCDFIRIFDTSGSVVYEQTFFSGTILPLNLKNGVYFIQLSTSEVLRSAKLVVNN